MCRIMNFQAVDTVVGVTLGSVMLMLLWIFLRLAIFVRPWLPVTVNCWFCQKNFVVQYKYKNAWNCPNCLQYNGFDESGGYNKEIPEQFFSSYCKTRYAVPSTSPSKATAICKQCSKLQEYKVKKLAEFQPSHPAMFDREVEIFQRILENNCQLCQPCQTMVSKLIHRNLVDALNREQTEFLLKCRKSTQPRYNKNLWHSVCHLVGSVAALCLGCAIWLRVTHVDNCVASVLYVASIIVQSLELILMYRIYVTSFFILMLLVIVMKKNNQSLLNATLGGLWSVILLLSMDVPESLATWKVVDLELPFLLAIAVFHILAISVKNSSHNLKNYQLIKLSNNFSNRLLDDAEFLNLVDKNIDTKAGTEPNKYIGTQTGRGPEISIKKEYEPQPQSQSCQVMQDCPPEDAHNLSALPGNIGKLHLGGQLRENFHRQQIKNTLYRPSGQIVPSRCRPNDKYVYGAANFSLRQTVLNDRNETYQNSMISHFSLANHQQPFHFGKRVQFRKD